MRKQHRSDANQAEIVKHLRRLGVSVAVTSLLGGGFPDLVLGWQGQNHLVEVKDRSRGAGKLRDSQIRFHQSWRGKVHVIESFTQAVQLLGIYTSSK